MLGATSWPLLSTVYGTPRTFGSPLWSSLSLTFLLFRHSPLASFTSLKWKLPQVSTGRVVTSGPSCQRKRYPVSLLSFSIHWLGATVQGYLGSLGKGELVCITTVGMSKGPAMGITNFVMPGSMTCRNVSQHVPSPPEDLKDMKSIRTLLLIEGFESLSWS